MLKRERLALAYSDLPSVLEGVGRSEVGQEPEVERIGYARPGETEIVKVTVTELRENTYFARITIVQDGQELEIDSRPSDAIAIAVRCDAQIFAADEVVEESSIEFQGDADEQASLVTASSLSDLDPEEFRRFIETVTPEEFATSLEEALEDMDDEPDEDDEET